MDTRYVKFTDATFPAQRGNMEAIKELYLNPDEIESVAVGHNAAMVTMIGGRMFGVSLDEAKRHIAAKGRG